MYAFNRGESPDEILRNYPLLDTLARVYGAIAFYLDRKPVVDTYLANRACEFEAGTVPLSEAKPVLWEKLQRGRASL